MTTANSPKISIITVVRNGANTIRQTIESVLNQSWGNKEYIIIDGGSSDGTLDIIREYESHLAHWVSEPDNGIFDAMNKGINMASGDLIGILNADDWYEPEALQKVAKTFNTTDGKTVIHGMLRNFLDEKFYSVKGNSTRTLRYDMIQHPTCFVPASLYRELGHYNPALNYSADYDLILRWVNQKISFQFIEEIITNFRLGGFSSKPEATLQMINVMKMNGIISPSEALLRSLQTRFASFAKAVLK